MIDLMKIVAYSSGACRFIKFGFCIRQSLGKNVSHAEIGEGRRDIQN